MHTLRPTSGPRALGGICVCLALAALLGCGGGGDATKGKISGKVVYKGAPVTGGLITLYSAGTNVFSTSIRSDGTFLASDAPAGTMQATVDTDMVPESTAYKMPAGSKDAIPPDLPNAPKKVVIPAKYKDPKTSGLSWEIKAGSNPEKVIELAD